MVAKAKKTDTVKGAGTTVPVVNVEVTADTVTSKTTTAKTPRTKPTKTVKEVLPVVEENTVVTTTTNDNTIVSEVSEVGEVDLQFTDSFTSFMTKLQSVVQQMNALKTEFRVLEKKALRELKAAQKVQAKKKRKSGNRSPSGFVKPTLISDELANFLKKPSGTEMARTEVTREINSYIRANDLQDKQNGRKINPDANLTTLLKIGKGDELTYFNLQRYMSPHFAKASSITKP